VARWFRPKLVSLLARPFVCECHMISTLLRFQLPLIEPDVRLSHIRLSFRTSGLHIRHGWATGG